MRTGSHPGAAASLVALIALIALIGCGAGAPGAGPDPAGGTQPASEPTEAVTEPAQPPPSCPLGLPAWTQILGLASPNQAASIAVDPAGDVLFATAGEVAGNASGLTKLSSSGEVLYARPFGSVVATDRTGNAYVAGAFRVPLDLGTGAIEPACDSDVFVAKLDADGQTLFARALALCDDQVRSIAVDRTGRIAVSAASAGTVVLDARGQPRFSVQLSGALAFDARGRLAIAGPLAPGSDLGDGPVELAPPATDAAFVIELDRAGHRVWSQVLPGSGVQATGVAVDRDDSVVLVGYYAGFIDLFGDVFRAIFSPESGRVTGAYVAKLDRHGKVVWKDGMAPAVEANGVATDPAGDVLVNGAATGNVGFFRIETLWEYDAAGALVSVRDMFPASGYGRGFGVAVDACGSILAAVDALDTASASSPVHAYLVKLPRRLTGTRGSRAGAGSPRRG